MLATQEMPGDAFLGRRRSSLGLSAFGLGRRRSSLGLSAFFSDHQVPQFINNLDSMLGDGAVPLTPSVLHEDALGSPGWERDSFGAVPSLSGPGSEANVSNMMLCDVNLGYGMLGELKAVKKEQPDGDAMHTSIPAPTPTPNATGGAAATTITTATPPTRPTTPAAPAGAGADADAGTGTPKAVLKVDALTHWPVGPASPALSVSSCSSYSSYRSTSSESESCMDTMDTAAAFTHGSPHATRGVTQKAAAAADADADAASTPAPAERGPHRSIAPSKRSRKDANKCATVLAAMPKPPRRNRGTVSRLDEMTRHMSPERARLEKNRQSAKECRIRKKEYVGNLEKKISELELREARRITAMDELRAQLAALQEQVRGTIV